MSSRRPAMIGSVVREVVAPLLRECPHACGMVSLTEVEVSADLSYATCLISALASPDQAVAFLTSRLKDLHTALGRTLQIHRVPKIRFRIDPRSERGARIDRLLEGS
ncbi:MAG: ribosome-binding factor A [Candidatus Peribacter sp.]|nr:ribosome-binding factor A [Candidatus Peribacter sp.]